VLNPEFKGFIITAHFQVAKKLKEAWLSYKDIIQWKLQSIKALIALKEVVNHSSKDQFATLCFILKDYNIVQQVGAIISNNAKINDTLC
jgi:hypothetical protein